MGLMWLENAREMRLNPPPEDIRAVSGSEALWVETEKGPVSLFAANDGYPCRVSYSPGLARWEKEAEGRTLNLTAFVPMGQDARVYMINGAAGMTLKWGLKPSLGAREPPPCAAALRTAPLLPKTRRPICRGPCFWRVQAPPAPAGRSSARPPCS